MRNVFNRMLLILLGLIAVVAGVCLILLESGVVSVQQLSPAGILQRQWQFLHALSPADAGTAVIVAVVLVLLGMLLLLVELWPGRRGPAQFVVQRDAHGVVAVARSSVNDLVRYVATTVPGIVETREAVSGEEKGLRVRVRAAISPEAVAPEVGRTLQEKVQQALQHHLGLPVATVEVATQVEPLQHRRRVR